MKKTLCIILSLTLAATAHALILGPSGATVTYAPNAPTLSSVSSASATSLSLVWSYGTTDASHSAATSVSVYRGTSAGAESGTPVATGVTTSPWADTGLTTGQAYYYYLKGVNTAGSSVASNEMSGTPTATVYAPSPPTIGTATAGNASASVAFTPGIVDGTHSAATSYTATSSPGSITGTGASSPISVTGLTNGTPYTFTVTASNSAGPSSSSSASNSVTPSAGSGYTENWATLDTTKWGTSTAGSGSVSVASNVMTLTTGSTASNAALIYYKTPINTAASETYGLSVKATATTNSATYPIAIFPGVPAVGASGSMTRESIQVSYSGNETGLQILYFDTGGTPHWYTGGTWSASQGYALATTSMASAYYNLYLVTTGTQWQVVVKDYNDNTLLTTGLVNWSAIRGAGSSFYFASGEIFNDIYSGSVTSRWFTKQ